MPFNLILLLLLTLLMVSLVNSESNSTNISIQATTKLTTTTDLTLTTDLTTTTSPPSTTTLPPTTVQTSNTIPPSTVSIPPTPPITIIEPDPVYRHRPQYPAILHKLFLHINKHRLQDFVQTFSLFHNRHPKEYEGPSQYWLSHQIRAALSQYEVGPSSLREIDTGSASGAYYQKNLVAIVEGQDLNLRSNLVILGAHYDTFPSDDGAQEVRAPGADDNASGCAILMEVLRLVAEFGIKFKFTVEFHFYTGKELTNLQGSKDIIHLYIKEQKIQHDTENRGVKGMLNIDSVGYQLEKKAVGFCRRDGNGNVVSNSHLTSFLEMLATEYSNFTVERLPKLNGCFSDNFSWHEKGYPAACVTEVNKNPFRDNNFSEKDTHDLVNVEQLFEYAKVALAFAIELGELNRLPNIPDPQPPPTATEFPLPTETGNTETEPDPGDPDEDSRAMKLQVSWSGMGLIFLGNWMLY
ncbi:unnamed protein product [Orchesella dallaii]|uniref:Peptidase M28 domain-containing protein n=1 Tax=Orchesella dallaii TaxID=48710 RepID=A0ABP1S4W2_9HEXA